MNTIGMAWVSRNTAAVAGAVHVRMTLGFIPTSSTALARMRSVEAQPRAPQCACRAPRSTPTLQHLLEGCQTPFCHRIVVWACHQDTHRSHALLPTRHHRPSRRAAESRDERAPVRSTDEHQISSPVRVHLCWDHLAGRRYLLAPPYRLALLHEGAYPLVGVLGLQRRHQGRQPQRLRLLRRDGRCAAPPA